MNRTLLYPSYLVVFLAFAIAGVWLFGGQDGVALRDLVTKGPHASGEDQRVLYVYVTSPDCDACSSAEHVRFIRRSKRSLQDRLSENSDHDFSSVLVSTDMTPLQGLSKLEDLGPFDEINIGNGRRNLGSTTFIWEQFPSKPKIPQLSLFLIRYSGDGDRIQIKSRTTLLRLIGAREIGDWARDGFQVPLPDVSEERATSMSDQ